MLLPKISVIVPVYNNEKFLPLAVESLLGQSYTNLEIILIDDGSTDNSGVICDKFAEENSNIIVIHQPNAGVSSARNAGLEIASGSMISFCDGDDTAESDLYEFLYRQMVKNDSDIACCACHIFTDKGSFFLNYIADKMVWEKNDDFIRVLFKGQVPMGVYNKLFKKEVLENVRFPQGYRNNEDKYFCFLASLNAKKVSFENEGKYNYYRREGSSSMVEFSQAYFDSLKLAEKMLNIVIERKPHLIEYAKCNLLATVLMVYKLMCKRNGFVKYKTQESKMYEYVKKFDVKMAKKYLTKNNYIRFTVLRMNKTAFKLMTKLADNK